MYEVDSAGALSASSCVICPCQSTTVPKTSNKRAWTPLRTASMEIYIEELISQVKMNGMRYLYKFGFSVSDVSNIA